MRFAESSLPDDAAIELDGKPECLILNKSDRLAEEDALRLAHRLGGIPVSALSGAGLAGMLEEVEKLAFPGPAGFASRDRTPETA